MAELDLFVVDDNAIQEKTTKFIEQKLDEPLYAGDERKIFTEVLLGWVIQMLVKLNELFNQRFVQYAHGKILDAHGINEGCERLDSTKSSSTERFNVAVPLAFNVVIPKGTRVTGDNNKYFATDSVAVIYAGSTYVDVKILAENGGAAYNGYTVGQLNKLVDKIEYISSVTNLTATTGGDDGEPYPEVDGGVGDAHYYDRIRLSKATKSTAGAEETYKYYAKSADPRISDAYVSSPEAGKINISIALTDGTQADKTLLDKVLEICSAKHVRPLGDKLSTSVITQKTYDIELKYYTTQAEESAVVSEIEGTGGAIERYNEWQTTEIGRAINPDRLRAEILKSDTKEIGAERVTITKPEYTKLSEGQIAKWSGTLTISHEVVDGKTVAQDGV